MAGLAGWIAWLFGLDYLTAQIVTASLIVSLFAILLVRLAYPAGGRRGRAETPTTTSKDSSAGENGVRIVDLTSRGREKGEQVLTEALAAETARLLERALKHRLVQPVLVSPQCPPGARVLLDPVNQEIICVDAERERGAKIASMRLGAEVEEELEEPSGLDNILNGETKDKEGEERGGGAEWE